MNKKHFKKFLVICHENVREKAFSPRLHKAEIQLCDQIFSRANGKEYLTYQNFLNGRNDRLKQKGRIKETSAFSAKIHLVSIPVLKPYRSLVIRH